MTESEKKDDFVFTWNEEKLNQLYEDVMKLYKSVEDKHYIVPDIELEQDILTCISRFETLHGLVTYKNRNNSYQKVDDIPTEDLKYLLIPCFIGHLSRRIVKIPKYKTMLYAKIHLSNFLITCRAYGLAEESVLNEDPDPSGKEALSVYLTLPLDDRMKREEKMLGYVKKVSQLHEMVQSGNSNDQIKREYILARIRFEIFNAIEKLMCLKLEYQKQTAGYSPVSTS